MNPISKFKIGIHAIKTTKYFLGDLTLSQGNNYDLGTSSLIEILGKLDIENNSSISELLLKHFTSETRSKDNWKCDKCNNNCNYNKTSIIWKYPDVLFISLNRFKEIIKKNLEIVNINKHLIYIIKT